MTRLALERGEMDYPAFLDELASGKSLKACCDELSLSQSVVLHWVRADEDRAQAYDTALRVAAEVMVHETLTIADGSDEPKLRVDTRFRVAKSWDKGRYGDAPGMTLNVGAHSLVTILSGMWRAGEQPALVGESSVADSQKNSAKIPEIQPRQTAREAI